VHANKIAQWSAVRFAKAEDNPIRPAWDARRKNAGPSFKRVSRIERFPAADFRELFPPAAV